MWVILLTVLEFSASDGEKRGYYVHIAPFSYTFFFPLMSSLLQVGRVCRKSNTESPRGKRMSHNTMLLGSPIPYLSPPTALPLTSNSAFLPLTP